ncbi:MAG: hypothetical protein A2Y16_05360 [Tenericutes bacterium GWF2_57_13]|nr:MAG: hypothetical protein A2Y16_05360 [Tenericutes bacterium GWF2_57_13]
MYTAIYSYISDNGIRRHLGNITDVDVTRSDRTYDMGSIIVSGYCDFDMKDAMIYVICSDRGTQQENGAGFVKNVKVSSVSGDYRVEFVGEDLKRIYDTDIILDFTGNDTADFLLDFIFSSVTAKIATDRDPLITKVRMEFDIPIDVTDTTVIADYTGKSLTVNAADFLKVYLAYYRYFIKPAYNPTTDTITSYFIKASATPVSISLRDFIHERSSADIKVNKVVATVAFEPEEVAPTWLDALAADYDTAYNNRAILRGIEPPDPTGYNPSFVIKLVSSFYYFGISIGTYNAVSGNKLERFIDTLIDPTQAPTQAEAEALLGLADNWNYMDKFKVCYRNQDSGYIYYNYPRCLAIVAGVISYHKLSQITYIPRPDLPEVIYTLGKDNEIYQGYAPEDKRFYPIVAKIFEAEYLSKAQVNAVYELVSNRYIENIIIDSSILCAPLDLGALELLTMIRIYDSQGAYKDLPISERNFKIDSNSTKVTIKLGFKRTLLTEIIKSENPTRRAVRDSGGSGSGTHVFVQKFPIWEGTNAPDPDAYDTWFHPIEEE